MDQRHKKFKNSHRRCVCAESSRRPNLKIELINILLLQQQKGSTFLRGAYTFQACIPDIYFIIDLHTFLNGEKERVFGRRTVSSYHL